MSARLENLRRLLNPQCIAFVGGADADYGARQCAETFDGPVWGVNPNRQTLGGLSCYKSVEDLPAPPDAVFLATPRSATPAIMRQLNQMGAGGVACFTAGYGELGESGQQSERELVEATGELALVGPNCYGLINYTNGATLWPFGSGRQRCQKGIALIMQSGMLPANLTMNERSLPISYVISAGNQAALAIEDYIDLLADDPKVTAIGLYIEGVKNISSFAAASAKATSRNKPVVVLKAGSSTLGSSLSVSHTGSLAGTDQAFQALFDQLGILRVDSPVALIETLKFLSVSGAPRGRRLAGFTCSGGDATMLADYCQKVGLELPQPSQQARAALTKLLPDIATVSNPLDYTVPLWGDSKNLPTVMSSMLVDDFDAAVIIQDFPPPHIHADNSHYRNDANSFIEACKARGIPAAVCSDLPENIDRETRELIIAEGVTPLQGLDAGLEAISLACAYGLFLNKLTLDQKVIEFKPIEVPDILSKSNILHEWAGKSRIKSAGVDIPPGVLCHAEDAVEAASRLGYPVVVKAVSTALAHKSEVGAVKINLPNGTAVALAITEIQTSIKRAKPDITISQFLVETMIDDVLGELLVGINIDAQFGQIMVIAAGGIWVELMKDSVTLLLPTNRARVLEALQRLKSFPLLQGFRGRPACDLEQLLQTILSIARFAEENQTSLLEMDINPLMITPNRVIAADVMIREVNRHGV